MSEPITTPCGKTKTRQGHPYTPEKLADHLRTCPRVECAAHRKAERQKRGHAKMLCDQMKAKAFRDGTDPLGLLDDDMPDGAYWAMHNEIYG
jgi:hypothetical protein